ncbi:hypothetical protein [Weizmannia phage Youna2]
MANKRIRKKQAKATQYDWLNDPGKVAGHLFRLLQSKGYNTMNNYEFHNIEINVWPEFRNHLEIRLPGHDRPLHYEEDQY